MFQVITPQGLRTCLGDHETCFHFTGVGYPMPVLPSTWITNMPVTAHQLNQDLFTYDGSFFGANGTFFHSNRPLLVESYILNSTVGAGKGGTFTVLGGTRGSAINILDNASLYGGGSDFPGDAASFQ